MASDDQSRIYSTLYGPFKLSYDAQKGHYEKGVSLSFQTK